MMLAELMYNNEVQKLKQFNKDLEWFQSNYERLKTRYKGQYIAIKNGKVVSHDSDIHRLLGNLRKAGHDTSSMVIEHVHEHRVVYVL